MTDLLPPSSLAGPSPGDGNRLRALIADIRATTREVGRLQAVLIRRRAEAMQIALAESARSGSRASREREIPVRSVALEIAVATNTHDLTVQKELGDAHTLTEKFGTTVDALEKGRITLRHVQAILETGIVIDDDDTRGGWEKVVLTRAERDSPGRVRAFARELAESVQPEGMTARHARAAQTRGVSVRDLADGMAELSVILPATVAYGIRDRLRRQAAVIRQESAGSAPGPAVGSAPPLSPDSPSRPSGPDERTSHDERTLAQIGADLCADLLLTASPAIDPTTDETCPGGLGAIRAQVQITVPVLTLLGHTDAGAAVAGRSPIDPDTARHLARHAPGWDRVLCDPVTGTVLEVDRYSPTAAQRRYLAARDQHCRAPGCRAPLTRCQLDHNHEAQHGGATRLTNLAHLCVRHHTLKTETAWTVSQDPDGTLRFESPLGQRRAETPPPRIMFLPDADGSDDGGAAGPPDPFDTAPF
ncbi:HNH endonuclease [Microbacterium testaceum]|uniref:HNH endonuclease n=1 Tax=Microbacterium testaceum TaxID=2033 RepID=UPI000733F539|nr:HNH endonuclease signature motif containing protein [Microbacterium testaceum]